MQSVALEEPSVSLADGLDLPTADLEDTTSLNDAELEAELEAQLQAELDAEGPMSSADEVPSTEAYDPANDDAQLAAEAELEAELNAELDAAPAVLPPAADLEVHAQAPAVMPLATSSEPLLPGMVGGRLSYPTALFDRTTVTRMADAFLRLLTGLTRAPGRGVHTVDIVSDVDRALLAGWNRTHHKPFSTA